MGSPGEKEPLEGGHRQLRADGPKGNDEFTIAICSCRFSLLILGTDGTANLEGHYWCSEKLEKVSITM